MSEPTQTELETEQSEAEFQEELELIRQGGLAQKFRQAQSRIRELEAALKQIISRVEDCDFLVATDVLEIAQAALAPEAPEPAATWKPGAIVRWHKYDNRGEGFEDRDPHDDENPDYIRHAIDEALEEVAQRLERGWQIPQPATWKPEDGWEAGEDAVRAINEHAKRGEREGE